MLGIAEVCSIAIEFSLKANAVCPFLIHMFSCKCFGKHLVFFWAIHIQMLSNFIQFIGSRNFYLEFRMFVAFTFTIRSAIERSLHSTCCVWLLFGVRCVINAAVHFASDKMCRQLRAQHRNCMQVKCFNFYTHTLTHPPTHTESVKCECFVAAGEFG